MKKKIKLILLPLLLFCSFIILPACNFDMTESIKAITKPYIAEYECTEAYLGGENLLEKYEYIKITLINAEEMELSFKATEGKKHTFTGNYTVDPKTRELSGEIGVLGMKFREKVTVEKGQFTITKNILNKPLLMKFNVK